MSVTDPLLKSLKNYILTFRLNSKQPITDEHGDLESFCDTLELILKKGLLDTLSLFGVSKRDYWSWILHLYHHCPTTRPVPTFRMVVEYVHKSPKVVSLQGRGRLFIREALNRRILLTVLQLLLEEGKIIENWYDPSCSILGNEILLEIFISLVREVSLTEFALTSKNASFLDDTWHLPVYKEVELVPCNKLGVKIKYVPFKSATSGFPVVVYVSPGGVVEDCGQVEIGDILDEVCHKPTRSIRLGQLTTVVQQNRNRPFHLSVIKCKTASGSVYQPVGKLLQLNHSDINLFQKNLQKLHEKKNSDSVIPSTPPTHAILPEDQDEHLPVHHAEDKAVYEAYFVAAIPAGKDGSIRQIERVVQQAWDDHNPETSLELLQAVMVELDEIGVTVRDKATDEEIQRHSFTKIAACGRRLDKCLYYCLLVGDTSCAIADDFIGYVFRAKSEQECKIILCAAAQGFDRTHWSV